MRRKSRAEAKREKTVMILSSVFVLAALTVTGLLIKGKSEEKNDGYVVDFSAIEKEAGDREQLAKQETAAKEPAVKTPVVPEAVTADDLDYDPSYQETASPKVENPGQASSETDAAGKLKDKKKEKEEGMFDEAVDTAKLEEMKNMEDTMALATSTSIQPALTFGDGDSLSWPIVGNILINYSMDKTIYFPTLQQYKYNPAIIISAAEGQPITAAAAGKVVSVAADPELGNVVVMELGGGYEITYGQLKDITVSEGGYVDKGDLIGSVAAPTKYYIVEGTNVYFKVTKDGVPVDPMKKLN